jgi:hypothetical protein
MATLIVARMQPERQKTHDKDAPTQSVKTDKIKDAFHRSYDVRATYVQPIDVKHALTYAIATTFAPFLIFP